MGLAIWRQYCAEHNIDEGSGIIENQTNDRSLLTFYQETQLSAHAQSQFIPRTIMIDTDSSVIETFQSSSMSKLFDPLFLIHGNENASNNFARGHYTIGKELIDTFCARLRLLVEDCDNVQGFFINHSVAAGTGSGLGALILERIAVDYRKKTKFGFEVYPSAHSFLSSSVVEAYNALLSTHWLLDHTDVSLVFDNHALYDICNKLLDIKCPTFSSFNSLIRKIASSITASLRFEGELNVDLNEFQGGAFCPFPRLHFMISGMAPIVSNNNNNYGIQRITESCFNPSNFFVKIADFDAEEDKYMSISLNYRGENVKSRDANACVQWMKSNHKVTFVDWCPTGFKIGLNEHPIACLEDDDMQFANTSAVMMANNTGISRMFSERISKKYDLMYSQRAYVHWYVGEGMEEGEFAEAREDLGFLQKDYLDVLSEQATDDDDSSDFDDEGTSY
jgi:tubulin alpha